MRQFPDVTVARPAAGHWSADRQAIDDVLGTGRTAPEALAALTLVTELRTDLDRAERQLITQARERGASWRVVATALGLSSRQAAEQRWLRLRAGEEAVDRARDAGSVRRQRHRQQKLDEVTGEDVVALRREAARLRTRLIRRPYRPDPRDPHLAAVRLAARTLSAADQASPGALYDLVRLAVADLRGVPAGNLGRPLTEARDRVATLARRPPNS